MNDTFKKDEIGYVLVTAAHNECNFIEKTIESVIRQTVLPKKWIIVSDRSTDGTDEIVSRYASQYSFIQLVSIVGHSGYEVSMKVNAFNAGYVQLKNIEYDFIGNLDADVSFDSTYYENILKKFQQNPKLAIAGGVIFDSYNGKYIEWVARLDSVGGPIQMFRRKFFEEIEGYILIPGGGEDAVAEHLARRYGWEVSSFSSEKVLHLRRMGTANKGILKSRFCQGKRDYLIGYHPLFEIVKCARRIVERPYFIGSMFWIFGFFYAWLFRIKSPVPRDISAYIKKEQMQFLKKKIIRVIKLFFVFYIGIIFFSFSRAYAQEESRITVDCKKEIQKINKKVFGNNMIAYDPSTYENRGKEYYGYSDYGAGIWDSKWNKPQMEVVNLAKDAGITVARFPGGCGTHHYDWKKAVGKDREHFLYGLDEFLETCELIGAEPLITVSYFTGSPEDAGELVKYLENNKSTLHPPFSKEGKGDLRVKYFEIGNEVWHGDHRDIKKVLPEEYAQKYLEYYKRMKEIDSSIQVGIVLYTPEWDKKVMEIVKDKIDFGIIHTYPTPVWGKGLEAMKAEDILGVSLAMPVFRDEYNFQEALKLLKEKSGKNVPLAITEYNGGFAQDKPVPYRHCLGTALLNAELLRIFIKPENNILCANYWDFVNEYWGMIANGFGDKYADFNKPYYKRPNYYVYELYHQHFGDVLLDADVECGNYDVSGYDTFKDFIAKNKATKAIEDIPLSERWSIDKFKGVEVELSENDLIINFQELQQFNYYHTSKTTQVKPDTYYKLSGYIKTENLIDAQGVCLEIQDRRGWNQTHSAASTGKIKGTTDWQYVEAVYRTLADAQSVKIIARRIGDKGPLKGKAYFKDVRLERVVPSVESNIPYLTVNASKSSDGNKVYLMVVNKNLEEEITADISIPGFEPEKSADAWVLNGPSVDATNEQNHSNVKVAHKKFDVLTKIASSPSASRNDTEQENYSFKFTFEPHSLTAIEIQRKI